MNGEVIIIKDGLGNKRKIKFLEEYNFWIHIDAPYGNNEKGRYLVATYNEVEKSNLVEINPKIVKKPRYFKARRMTDRRTFKV